MLFQNPLNPGSAEDGARRERAKLLDLSSRKRDAYRVTGIEHVINYDEQTVNEIIFVSQEVTVLEYLKPCDVSASGANVYRSV